MLTFKRELSFFPEMHGTDPHSLENIPDPNLHISQQIRNKKIKTTICDVRYQCCGSGFNWVSGLKKALNGPQKRKVKNIMLKKIS